MKLLACEVMNSQFPSKYPKIVEKEKSILEILFRMNPENIQTVGPSVRKWILSTYPVEKMRKTVIKEYFLRMKQR